MRIGSCPKPPGLKRRIDNYENHCTPQRCREALEKVIQKMALRNVLNMGGPDHKNDLLEGFVKAILCKYGVPTCDYCKYLQFVNEILTIREGPGTKESKHEEGLRRIAWYMDHRGCIEEALFDLMGWFGI